MDIRIVSRIGTVLFMAFATSDASAAVWAWGCRGELADEQIVFNRYNLVVAPAKPALGDIRDLIHNDNIVPDSDALSRFESKAGNGGFESKMEFIRDGRPEQIVVFTEKSSRKIKGSQKRVGPRDEYVTTFRKVYRYQRATEPPRDITMECVEYMLSTKGGRS